MSKYHFAVAQMSHSKGKEEFKTDDIFENVNETQHIFLSLFVGVLDSTILQSLYRE